MKLSKTSKRLGVFVFFDRDSIIDDYVIYLLDSLNEAVDKILFVSNCNLSKEELKKLDKYNIDINIRENKGLDAGAFKYVYDKYGKDYICEYDELILLNDTFFGPFIYVYFTTLHCAWEIRTSGFKVEHKYCHSSCCVTGIEMFYCFQFKSYTY